MSGRIVVVKGYDRGKSLDLNRTGTYCIGRGGKGKEVDFKVDPCEYLTSRLHFFIDYRPPHFYIRDNNSTNGTLLIRGDAHIPVYTDDTVLCDGDRIVAGNTVFQFDVLQEAIFAEADEIPPADQMPAEPGPNLNQAFVPPVQKHAKEAFVASDSLSDLEHPALSESAAESGLQNKMDWPASHIPSPAVDYYSVIVPEIQLFHSTIVKCIACGSPITLEVPLSDLEANGFPVFMCQECSDTHFESLNLKNLYTYRILKELNDDGRGLVYLVRHEGSGMLATLRAIIPRTKSLEEDMQSLKHEVSRIQELTHPNLVRMYESMVFRDRIYLISEYMPEGDLDQLLKSDSIQMSWNDACRFICDILAGLRHCHERGIVHGDIRPGSILFKRDAKGNPCVRLGDLGVSWICDRYGLQGANDSLLSGTAKSYIAPELLKTRLNIRPQADIYAVGVLFYTLLCNESPFEDRSPSAKGDMAGFGRMTIPLQCRNPDIPTPLARIVDRAIRENPSDRYESAAQMLQAILDMRFL